MHTIEINGVRYDSVPDDVKLGDTIRGRRWDLNQSMFGSCNTLLIGSAEMLSMIKEKIGAAK